MRVVYLATPMDTGSADQTDAAVEMLRGIGLHAFLPHRAWSLSPDPSEEDAQIVVQTNLAAIHEADALLALMPEDTRSMGVPIEVLNAAQHGKPVAMVGPSGLILTAMSVPCFDYVAEAIDYLANRLGVLNMEGSRSE